MCIIAREEKSFRQLRYASLRRFFALINDSKDYAICEANTVYGKIGVKVWICRGEVFGKRDLSPNIGLADKGPATPKSAARGGDRRGGDRNDRGGKGRRK